MQAARYYGIEDIRVEEIDRPEPAEDQVLIRVEYAGICGSDLHIYKKGMFMEEIPQTMGHEFAGVVAEVGAEVEDFVPGDRVVGDPRDTCGECYWCSQDKYNICPEIGFIGEVAPGCFARYITLPVEKVLALPSTMDLKQAALVEPLAVALHIARRGNFSTGSRVGIIGAGPIGLLTLLVAREIYDCGSIKVIDIDRRRLELAEKLGADEILTTIGQKVEVAVEVAGNEFTLNAALDWLQTQGRLVIAAVYEERVELDPNQLVAKEIYSAGAHAYDTQDLEQAIEILDRQKLDISPVVSHILPLTEIDSAFKMLTGKEKRAVKILLKPE